MSASIPERADAPEPHEPHASAHTVIDAVIDKLEREVADARRRGEAFGAVHDRVKARASRRALEVVVLTAREHGLDVWSHEL